MSKKLKGRIHSIIGHFICITTAVALAAAATAAVSTAGQETLDFKKC